MRILIIAPGCAPNQSGFSLRVFNWIQMIKNHAEVHYFSTYQQTDPGAAHYFYYQSFSENWNSKIKKLWTYYKVDFVRMQKTIQPDIVQIHTPYFFGLKKLFPNVPVVLVEHDVNWNLLKYDMTMGPGIRRLPWKFPLVPWLQWRAKQTEKKFLNGAYHTFVCSPIDKKEILKELPGLERKITVIPNCLDLSSYRPSNKEGESVLFMGSMTYSANLDAVDTICKEVAPRLPKIPFQIAGSGTYSKPFPPNVHFLGHVKNVRPFLEKCRIFIAPLRFGSGTRWKILEAFAMQRPVVATPKGVEGLEVTPGKNILIEEKWDFFAKAIEELWDNPDPAKIIAQNGRNLVETQYDYRIYTTKVMQIYQSLL